MKKLIVILISFISYQSFATSLDILKSDDNFIYSDYYKVKEDPRFENINLISFEHINEKFPYPAIPYNRDTQFGGWLRDAHADSCLNTRGKVLVRDSVSSVSYTPNGCTVASGEWNEVYTAKTYTSAQDLQIDHLVPLKNAYMTGAHEWDFKKRCLYANYLGNNFHLLAVFGKENMKKSDSSPSAYIPPNKNFTCQYLKIWLNVKLIWSLRITPKEEAAIESIAEQNNCNTEMFVIPASALKEQRDYIQNHSDLCADKGALEAFN